MLDKATTRDCHMKHDFYLKSKKEQNKIQILIGLCALTAILVFSFVSILLGVYVLAIFAFTITISIIAPFYDTPSLKRSGNLIYHSPLFISEKPKKGLIKIHGGTLFDYVFVIDRKMNGNLRTKFILQQYVEGLLGLIDQYENSPSQDLKIRGTSYIINERTAKRTGFEVTETDSIQTLILIYNYFNLLISCSIAKGKLSFPNLKEIKTFETTLENLIDQKDFLSNMNEKLKRTNY